MSPGISQLLACGAVGLSLLASVATSMAQSQPAATHEVSVCDLVAKSAQYNGKVVRVRARLLSDDIHPMVLVDSRCALGVSLFYNRATGRHPSSSIGLDDFRRALADGMAGTLDKEIHGVFVGRFSYRRSSRRPERLIELVDVLQLSVIKK